ncbi:MAG: Ni/Fe-hydrogenase cytochrome b subunit [Bryobacterales bacterium]|nr:Ni/Fe-hydrogenase cytochrome b subunit [Bryobacteraceae bacterium]MDW8130710.1 Ni/Fe-hydrogenase cytochrome b subunit [Bryobacterales bacterium]
MIQRLFWRWLALAILAAGAYATVVRFAKGLGAATNLSDQMPWGLWVGFDVLCGVGLAAGGFTITTAVYILHLEKLRPIVRPAVLTAFLGYLLVILALVYDLGRPWNIWRATVMWNPRSVMFEVAWCVMLYTTVLAVEFSPLLFDKLGWWRASRVARAAIVPLTAAGFILSTLHQSSLGSLYLILPTKLHPLWYSPLLPWLFWFSAVAGGLAMVIFESGMSARAFGRALELDVLEKLARAMAVFVGLFVFLRWWDLLVRGHAAAALHVAGPGSLAVQLFWLEQALFLVPAGLALSARWRHNPQRLFALACTLVAGFLVHRLNVSTTALAAGSSYLPSWMEVAVTLMLVTLGVVAFRWAVRHLAVFPSPHRLKEEQPAQAVYA